MKKRIQNQEPLPQDPNGERLCEIFNHKWDWISAPNPTLAGEHPSWKSEGNYPIRPRALWSLWQDPTQLIGVRFAVRTHYGLIDIDTRSAYRNPQAISEICRHLEDLGIARIVIIQSSWSGGIHLYIPLPEDVSTWGLAILLRSHLESKGYFVKSGQLEIFPNAKSFSEGKFSLYNGHRLPLQPGTGSFLLSRDLQPIQGGLEAFLAQWDWASQGQDISQIKEAMECISLNWAVRQYWKRNSIEKWQSDLETTIQEGWTDYGQTNDILKAMACYGIVFLGLQGEELVCYIHRTAIQSPGFGQWCRHQFEIRQRAEDWARCAEGYYWPLGTQPKRKTKIFDKKAANNIVPFPQPNPLNQKRADEAKGRIEAAVNQLITAGTLPETITARRNAIAQIAKCSYGTLTKYQELWHPEFKSAVPDAMMGVIAVDTPTVDTTSESLESAPRAKVQANSSIMKGLHLGRVAPQEPSCPERQSPTPKPVENSVITQADTLCNPSPAANLVELTELASLQEGGAEGNGSTIESTPSIPKLPANCTTEQGIQFLKGILGSIETQRSQARKAKPIPPVIPDEHYFAALKQSASLIPNGRASLPDPSNPDGLSNPTEGGVSVDSQPANSFAAINSSDRLTVELETAQGRSQPPISQQQARLFSLLLLSSFLFPLTLG